MAVREVWLGSIGPFLYDDADTYPDSSTLTGLRAESIKINEAPTDPDHAVRLVDIPADSLPAHLLAADPHTQYQKESEKNAISGYAGLNSVSRLTKGTDTSDDIVIDLATKGLVLKDTQATAHYWRITISNIGVLVISDLGTTKP